MEDQIIYRIRSFNRFYVRQIGLLQNSVLNTGYSLTEAHILNELRHNPNVTATSINEVLQIDEGYLSRVIKKLINLSLITKKQSTEDKRKYYLNLTNKGIEEHQILDDLSSKSVREQIENLNKPQQLELADLMTSITKLLK